ncbi:glycine zipper family protein [Methylomonas sp. SURF-2]|uniref:Glycine zipper family protein n=1 Tax=Methylomonas subterranea TaxID=2952225 RepID=A0ABT1TG39_9GAMM|nr:glycine zipper family protein [Methylomonas sp. SURF-2]MCQ8104427.1 glycine zipper family protein [Methylomonas sp. SURF-2]
MKTVNLLVSLIAGVSVAGCAATTGWRPTVDTYNDRNAYRLEQDMHECQQLASQAASSVKETATGAVVGGLIGAAGGAAIGAVTGSPGKGAAIGAAAGGIGGAAKQGIQSDDGYRNAYRSCLRQRGHTVLN